MRGTLSCTATNCVNNMSGICSASTINILGSNVHSKEETQCETFAEKGLKNSFNNVLNMNVIGEIKQAFNNDKIEMSPKIECQVINCVHNRDEECVAHNIMVNGREALSSEKTECQTFKE
ncbi:DUF1540 domain-containing protein [Clostridium estertheticum]|uniref:DUF1540 domain-containing protein n=1 Tax=Clostridium estertheticum TaxID=238834 RepID=UPI001C7DDC93|nr:DUF1540 domain-containing protein [Clostridium estertheticum]MBX4263592.1 DUF1540 domain-containing protein [Clostridium estertheticum]MBX4268927.1 DUF1540 domain-containing protein [Clostridium estertheticum]WLC80346.1 DUF1540 domain-containing protein [Clostridium estertheticum]WLC87418.1 DUF1540 domain-containing protein [Clostridium estertheticum]